MQSFSGLQCCSDCYCFPINIDMQRQHTLIVQTAHIRGDLKAALGYSAHKNKGSETLVRNHRMLLDRTKSNLLRSKFGPQRGSCALRGIGQWLSNFGEFKAAGILAKEMLARMRQKLKLLSSPRM